MVHHKIGNPRIFGQVLIIFPSDSGTIQESLLPPCAGVLAVTVLFRAVKYTVCILQVKGPWRALRPVWHKVLSAI